MCDILIHATVELPRRRLSEKFLLFSFPRCFFQRQSHNGTRWRVHQLSALTQRRSFSIRFLHSPIDHEITFPVTENMTLIRESASAQEPVVLPISACETFTFGRWRPNRESRDVMHSEKSEIPALESTGIARISRKIAPEQWQPRVEVASEGLDPFKRNRDRSSLRRSSGIRINGVRLDGTRRSYGSLA